jgi:hypothetical protein
MDLTIAGESTISASLPANLSGAVYIRADDSDHGAAAGDFDPINVD